MKTPLKLMKPLVFTLLLLSTLSHSFAYTDRNLLQKQATLEMLKSMLIYDGSWVPYPDYTDRAGWESLLGDAQYQLIENGEKLLDFKWNVIKATDYLAYERTGDRMIMQNPFEQNRRALNALLIAELAEGKGRFLDQIINGVFQACETTSWTISAHVPRQSNRRSLPDWREPVIDLTSAGYGMSLSWIYYFLRPQLDQVDPTIAIRMKSEIERRVLEPFLQDLPSSWWTASRWKPGDIINNWNPWCNHNVLQCFLLVEDNRDRLADAVYQGMQSVDRFINYVSEDGACEEGPSYWGHAAGKLYDYLQVLYYATNGQVNLFDNQQIKNLGEYISRSYIGDGWVVNFADASAKGGGDASLIYLYGKAVGSDEMMQFASSLLKGKKPSISMGNDTYRSLESILCYQPLQAVPATHIHPSSTWYPETQFCYFTNKAGLFFAAKGGHNNESHNHNDIGTFILYANNRPLFIEAGVGTYTKKTFSADRYSIWTMQTNYHNLPLINGFAQKNGRQYKAADIKCDTRKQTFSLNIANAYPADAKIETYKRQYQLRGKTLTINDQYVLKEVLGNNQLIFMTYGKPNVEKEGVIELNVDGVAAQLYYPSCFTVEIEPIQLDDKRLSDVWGETIYRVILTDAHPQKTGKYVFKIVVE